MTNWNKYKFSEFVAINPKVTLRAGEVYPFIEMKDLSDNQKYCSPKVVRQLSSGSRFEEGDTLFARITPCLENGKIAQVKGLKKSGGFGSTEFLVFRGKAGLSDSDFVFYLSRSPEVREFAEKNFEGTSGRQRVPKNCFDNLSISAPEISEQRLIATTLKAIDDKIDLLRRQNETLEQCAQLEFQISFLVDSEEGILLKVEDIADHVKEGINPAKSVGEMFNHYSLPAFDEDRSPHKEIGKEILSNKYKIPSYSVLISKLNPRIPRIWSIYKEIEPNSICSTEFQIVKPKHKEYFSFIYCLLKSAGVTQQLASAVGGTSGSHQRVNPSDIFKLEFSVSSHVDITNFHNRVSAFWDKINLNHEAIRTLSGLRDSLLPKLISGELKLKHAQAQ